MKTLGQLFNELATKAGVDASNEHLKNILSNSELSKVTVHSDLAKEIEESLLSLATAKDNHPVLSNHYKAQILNGFDSRMDAVIKELGVPDEKLAEFKAEKNTFKRFENLTSFLQEAAKKSTDSGAEGKADHSALERQNADLIKANEELKKAHAAELAQAKSAGELALKAAKVDFKVSSILGGLKTAFDALPAEAKSAAIRTLLDKKLQDEGVDFAFDDSGDFTIKTKDGATYLTANQTKPTPQAFIEGILAENKVLVVAEPQGGNGAGDGSGKQGGSGIDIIKAKTDAPNGNNQTIAELNRRKREAAGSSK